MNHLEFRPFEKKTKYIIQTFTTSDCNRHREVYESVIVLANQSSDKSIWNINDGTFWHPSIKHYTNPWEQIKMNNNNKTSR